MDIEIEVNSEWTVKDLFEYEKEKTLKINHEYQRGLRWNKNQKQMFIDSIFRRYSIPAFYFHKTLANRSGNKFYEIVDGQQRLNAITSFCEDAYELLDPSHKTGFKFPDFLKGEDCPWGGKRFSELPKHLQNQMMNHKLVVYVIETPNENYIRDLFIRLQGGTPLTPQDKRDSWPGNFTDFVLTVGGKSGVNKWYGLPLFKEVAKVTNESNRRQLVAQIFMLYRIVQNESKFCEISSSYIDDFYHSNVNFDKNSNEAKFFLDICKKLHDIFQGKPKLFGHYLIHLVLLINQLSKEYAGGWERDLAENLYKFDSRRTEAAQNIKNGESHEMTANRYYYEYGQLTQTQSNQANNIRRRHAFFVNEMLELLSPKKLDPKRTFSDLERQTVFFRDKENCQWCKMNGKDHRVAWDECEIHHIIPHAQGGKTGIKNAALVHRECHPKSKKKTEIFEEWWCNQSKSVDEEPTRLSRQLPPNGTKIKMYYGFGEIKGEIVNRKIKLNDESFNSFSAASRWVTGSSRNGWKDWFCYLPNGKDYILADDWRKGKQPTSDEDLAKFFAS